MSTIIDIMRHGQTEWNKKTLIQGHIDNPLNETGRNQAKEIGVKVFKNDTYDIILVSPLIRAYETAQIISKYSPIKLEIITIPGLIERNFGVLEGQLVGVESYKRIFEESAEGLEKQKDLEIRAKETLLNIGNKYPNKKILIVSHSHFIKGALAYVDSNFDFTTVLTNLSVTRFKITPPNLEIIYYNHKL